MALRMGLHSRVETLQNSAQATGNGTAFGLSTEAGSDANAGNLDGAFDVIAVQVEGISGDTITFEVTIDGTNWYAVGLTAIADWSTVATTATADGIYVLRQAKGFTSFRARISTYGAGTIIVTAQAVA